MNIPEVSYSVHQAAERLGVSAYTIREMLREKRLRGFKLVDQWRIPAEAIAEYIEENTP